MDINYPLLFKKFITIIYLCVLFKSLLIHILGIKAIKTVNDSKKLYIENLQYCNDLFEQCSDEQVNNDNHNE
jgi:hypothetical protein